MIEGQMQRPVARTDSQHGHVVHVVVADAVVVEIDALLRTVRQLAAGDCEPAGAVEVGCVLRASMRGHDERQREGKHEMRLRDCFHEREFLTLVRRSLNPIL